MEVAMASNNEAGPANPLDNLPLVLTEKRPIAFMLLMLFLVGAYETRVTLDFIHGDGASVFLLIIFGGFFSFLLYAFVFRTLRFKNHLTISETGVKISNFGRSRQYLWSEITEIRKVSRGRGGNFLSIRGSSDLNRRPEEGIVYGNYGIRLDKLVGMLKA